MELAPIVVFAFNRPEALANTINSLLKNPEAKDSDVYFFVDGPRKNKNDELKVKEVQEFILSVQGFKSIQTRFSSQNKGLGPSIIEGVSQVINKYGKAIVLEDDLIFSANFLYFINQALNQYEKQKKVFSVCGYTNEVSVPADYKYDAYFCTRSSSWGWATWADRWNSVDWNLPNWNEVEKCRTAFNKWGGSDCFGMLKGWKLGKNKSWAIRFCFAQFVQDKLSLFPVISKVSNNGFDGQGTNCKKWSRFKSIFDTANSRSFSFPNELIINEHLKKSALSYHSISKRILSKLMYIIYSFK